MTASVRLVMSINLVTFRIPNTFDLGDFSKVLDSK